MSPILVGRLLLANNNWDWNHMGPGGWIFMGIGLVLFWGLVIFGIVWLVRTLTEHRTPLAHHAAQPSPLEVLDRKLAEGAISVEDYRERRRLLTGQSRDK